MQNETDSDSQSVAADPSTADPPEGQRAIRYVAFSTLLLETKWWANPRSQTGLDDASIEELTQSILSDTTSSEVEEHVQTVAGVRVPLEVVQIFINGAVVNLVIDGQRRYRAVEKADLPPDTLIPVFDLESEPVTWTRELADKYLLRALDAVGTRAGLSSFELSEAAQRLRGSRDPDTGKDFILAKIAQAIRRSESWVSKILAAREHASPKLLLSWKTGEITDEQFKDLAAERDPGKQRDAASRVVEARKEGDKTGARVHAKEQRIAAQAEPKPAKPPKASATKAPSSKAKAPRAQAPLPLPPPPARPVQPVKPLTKPSYAVVDDFLAMATKKPPTHDYVRGLMDGARWVVGLKDAATFAKPWQAYMRHVQGIKPTKNVQPTKNVRSSKKRRR